MAHRLAGDRRDEVEGFEDGDGIRASSADVIDLAPARRGDEAFHERGDIVAVNVVAHLFALVAEHAVGAAFEVALDEVAQEAVQLHTAVVRAGEAAAAQRAGGHPEVATILLHHHVRRDLRRAEEGVLALVNPEGLADAIAVGGVGVVPTLFQLHERNLVGCVAINLVRSHVDERRLGARLPRGFKKVQGAHRVHIEVIEWPTRGEIVTGLRGGVDERVRPHFLEQGQHARAIANIQFVMLKSRELLLESLRVPARVAAGAEEVRAHIVVHAVNGPAGLREMRDDFGADKARGTGGE